MLNQFCFCREFKKTHPKLQKKKNEIPFIFTAAFWITIITSRKRNFKRTQNFRNGTLFTIQHLTQNDKCFQRIVNHQFKSHSHGRLKYLKIGVQRYQHFIFFTSEMLTDRNHYSKNEKTSGPAAFFKKFVHRKIDDQHSLEGKGGFIR